MRADDGRSKRHRLVSTRLAGMSDGEIRALVGEATATAAGVGGRTGTVEVGGRLVFVKEVPLTALEVRHPHSTANLFGLPMHYQYGIGSAGFGAWRELATHLMTTEWVLGGRFDGFPLLHHWRVLDRAPQAADPVEVDLWVEHWDDSPAVRARLEAIGAAPAILTLFLEHLPYTMDEWLSSHPAYEWADLRLREGVRFLESNGLVHFDAHFRNLLTDGERVYFADFGLALHQGFEMRADEYAFFERHRGYDRAYTSTHLTQWLITRLLDLPWSEFPRALADRDLPLPPAALRIVNRNRPVASLMAEFWRGLETTRRDPRYPAELIEKI